MSVKRSGELWYVIFETHSGHGGSLDLGYFDFPHKDIAIHWCKDGRPLGFEGFTILAITNKASWKEGDGLELLE